MNTASAWDLLKETFSDYSQDKVPRLAAALAYYTAFAIAPLLVIAIAVAGFVFGREAASHQIAQTVSGVIGSTAGNAVNGMVQNAANNRGSGIVASIIGIITLLFAASGVFGELQDSLNTIWEVQPKPGQGIPRPAAVEQAAQLKERQLGGEDVVPEPAASATADQERATPQPKPAGAGAVTAFMLGLLLGRRGRSGRR